MSRPAVEVADILRAHEARFLDNNRSCLSFQQLTVLRAIARCRTAALGGHLDSCSRCGHQAISYNSCRNRHCPKCQTQARQRWLASREREVLGVPYFHVVFTLPHELNPLCQRNQTLLYNLLFRSSAAAMLEVAADPKHLGAEIGFLSILHTWGQNLLLHPHIHCVVPAGGLAPDHERWIHPKYAFFLPVKVLGRVLRGKFIQGLRRAFRLKNYTLAGRLPLSRHPSSFRRWCKNSAARTGWFTPRPPWAARRRSFAISAATLIALPSATIESSLTKVTKSPFAGEITLTATSNG